MRLPATSATEARRTFTYLSLFGYSVDAVVANRLLPEAVSDPFFDDWRRRRADVPTPVSPEHRDPAVHADDLTEVGG